MGRFAGCCLALAATAPVACARAPVEAPPVRVTLDAPRATPSKVPTGARSDGVRWCWSALPATVDDGPRPIPGGMLVTARALAADVTIGAARGEAWLGRGLALHHWSASTPDEWSTVAGPRLATGAPDLVTVIDPRGVPFVAFSQRDAFVATREGDRWSLLGRGLPGITGAPAMPRLALAPDGAPIVAWLSGDPMAEIGVSVARWVGGAWQTMGARLPVKRGGCFRFSPGPTLAIDPGGAIWVAWLDAGDCGPPSFVARVARWDGTAWRETAPLGASTRAPVLVAGARGVVAIWLEGQGEHVAAALARWDEDRWSRLPSPPGGDDGALPALAAAADGAIVAARVGDHLGASIDVDRLTTDGWRPVLSGMHLGERASRIASVAVAARPEGGLFVAWEDRRANRASVVEVHPCAPGEKAAPIPPPVVDAPARPDEVGDDP